MTIHLPQTHLKGAERPSGSCLTPNHYPPPTPLPHFLAPSFLALRLLKPGREACSQPEGSDPKSLGA